MVKKIIFSAPTPNSLSAKKRHQGTSATVAPTETESVFYKNYNHDSNASAGFDLCIKLMTFFPTNFQEFFRSTGKLSVFPGPWKKISKFQEFSRALEENFNIPGVFQGPGRKFQNSRSFPGP